MSPCTWIVIVNFRTSELTIDCLRSLSPQKDALNNGRVVVVDNDSGDGSVAKVRAAIDRENWHSWAYVLPMDRNGGFAFGNNAGIGDATGVDRQPDYVLLVNPDTIAQAGAIRALVDFMESHTDAGIAGSALYNSEGQAELSAHQALSPLGELVSSASLGILTRVLHRYAVSPPRREISHECDWVSGASMIVRRKVFEDIGLLDEGYFLYFEEVDFCKRALQAGWKIWFVPESRITHFEGASTGIRKIAVRRPQYWFDSRRRYFLKHFGVPGLLLADALWILGRMSLVLRGTLWRSSGGKQESPKGFSRDLLLGDLRSYIERLSPKSAQVLLRLRTSAQKAVTATIYWSGIGRMFEIATQPTGAIVLMYHSIAPDAIAEYIDPRNRMSPAIFDAQMAYLSKYRRVVPLSQVVAQIESGLSPPAGTVCITFDDGYLDNLTTAAPILAKYKLPATLFLATGYVERGEAQWADSVYWMLQRRTVDSLQIRSLGRDATDLGSEAASEHIYAMLHQRLLEGTQQDRKQLLEEIECQLKPKGVVPRLTLNWDDVRELCHRYPFFEIGGHTREHIDIQKRRDEVAREEIDGCARDLRRELGVLPRHFSYPYGRWCNETRQMVLESGWQSAVGSGVRIRVDTASDRFAITRVEAPWTMSELRFKTSGAYPGALSMLGMVEMK